MEKEALEVGKETCIHSVKILYAFSGLFKQLAKATETKEFVDLFGDHLVILASLPIGLFVKRLDKEGIMLAVNEADTTMDMMQLAQRRHV